MSPNREKFSKIYMTFITVFPIILILVVLSLAAAFFELINLDSIMAYAAANPGEMLAIFLALYAVKSLSVAIPLVALYVACGSLLPPLVAVAVNSLGLLVTFSIPYGLGRLAGRPLVDLLEQKYPKLQKLTDFNEDNPWLVSYILRAIHMLPGDIVSMVLGAMEVEYRAYLFGSFGGLFPVMFFATLLGNNIRDIEPLGIVLTLLAIAASTLIPLMLYKRKKRKAAEAS